MKTKLRIIILVVCFLGLAQAEIIQDVLPVTDNRTDLPIIHRIDPVDPLNRTDVNDTNTTDTTDTTEKSDRLPPSLMLPKFLRLKYTFQPA